MAGLGATFLGNVLEGSSKKIMDALHRFTSEMSKTTIKLGLMI
jgi:hypothetical protein